MGELNKKGVEAAIDAVFHFADGEADQIAEGVLRAYFDAVPSPQDQMIGIDRLVQLMDEGHGGRLQCPGGADAASWGAGVNSGWDAAIRAVIALNSAPEVSE